jgi:hypothetical protein
MLSLQLTVASAVGITNYQQKFVHFHSMQQKLIKNRQELIKNQQNPTNEERIDVGFHAWEV